MNRISLPIFVIMTLLAGYLVGRATTSDSAPFEKQVEVTAVKEYKDGNFQQALAQFKQLAAAGDIDAAYYLGEIYRYGYGIDVDSEKAVTWLSAAANNGDVRGARQLGLLYLNSSLIVPDFEQAHKWLQVAADKGDELAMRGLGEMARDGLGESVDTIAAYAWYSAAAKRGDKHSERIRDSLERQLSAEQQQAGRTRAESVLKGVASLKPAAQNSEPIKEGR